MNGPWGRRRRCAVWNNPRDLNLSACTSKFYFHRIPHLWVAEIKMELLRKHHCRPITFKRKQAWVRMWKRKLKDIAHSSSSNVVYKFGTYRSKELWRSMRRRNAWGLEPTPSPRRQSLEWFERNRMYTIDTCIGGIWRRRWGEFLVDVPNSVTCLNHAWNVVNWVGVAPQTDTKKTHVFNTDWTACSKCDDYFKT